MRTHAPSDPRSAVLNFLGGLRDELCERRRARAEFSDLNRELASYRTPSEIDDLLAAVERHGEDPQVEQLRTILTHNLSDYRHRQPLAS